MEMSKTEVLQIERVLVEADEQLVCELNDLQLTLVGGGSGMVVVG